ncbi:MAG: UPF0182 family protein [Gemmatimonadales bacterium]|nr:UPF0182 family protein [Gemmatimonadales bacterium]
MSPPARRLAAATAAIVACLFAGRWLSTFLADRWWGELQSPGAAGFLTDLSLLKLVLSVAGALMASAWFCGNLLVVYRAIRSVEVSRRLANLEVREALTPGVLLGGTVVAGVVLGVLAGGDASRWWPEVALAWQGARFGVADPVLGHDAGTYVASLPLWIALLRFALLLVLAALGLCLLLYVVVGAIRWIEQRPAISDHARRHLGWLLAALGLLLAGHFLLEPMLLVGGARGTPGVRHFQLVTLSAPLLAGVAMSVALLSAVWALRPRHALALAGWLVFAASVFGARVIGTALVLPDDVPLARAGATSTFDALAFGVGGVRDSVIEVGAVPGAGPAWPALWQTEAVLRAGDADSFVTMATDPAWVVVGGARRPAWLAMGAKGGQLQLRALADAQVSATGAPLYYALADSVPGPAAQPLLALPTDALHPSAAPVTLDGPRGLAAGGAARRLALAWALQEGRLLGRLPDGARVEWERAPAGRLRRLAPFATWSHARPELHEGRLLWVADGYVAASLFPLSARVRSRDGEIGYLRAAFVGTVDAVDGRTRVFARPEAGPVAAAWTALAAPVVEPWTSAPVAVKDAATYPAELFRVQSRVLERAAGGRLVGVEDSLRTTPAVFDYLWTERATGPDRVASYQRGEPPAISSLLVGETVDGVPRLVRYEVEPAEAMPAPANLVQAWGRFPTFERVVDSVRGGGGTLLPGGVRFWIGPGQLGAMQVHYGPRGGGGASATWVSVAAHGRLGAGRSVDDAWSNLRGASAPLPPGYQPQSALTEARRWYLRADSALRSGDFGTFGRAFDALGATLDAPRSAPR